MADLKAFADQLVNLTVKEVNELASDSERAIRYRTRCSGCCRPLVRLLVSGAAAAEEKDLVQRGSEKRWCQQTERCEGCERPHRVSGLKEAKDLVDGAPKNVKKVWPRLKLSKLLRS